jgi:hemerythrin-like metal-binding protein
MAFSPFEIDPASLNFDNLLASGDERIDLEHRELLDAARALLTASSSGKNNKEIQTMLDNLVQELSHHFTHEDQIMHESGWSEAAQHAGIHQLLLVEANRLLDRHRSNMVSFLDIYRFIIGSLVRDHLAIHDVEFHYFLREQKDP